MVDSQALQSQADIQEAGGRLLQLNQGYRLIGFVHLFANRCFIWGMGVANYCSGGRGQFISPKGHWSEGSQGQGLRLGLAHAVFAL